MRHFTEKSLSTFTWDKTMGQNGDILHLTITSTTAIPSGALFEISSDYGGTSHNWVAVAGN